MSKLDRAYSPSLNRDISQTTAHPIVFEVKADRRRETKYHLEYKQRQTEKQNLEYKHRQTEKQNAILNTNTEKQNAMLEANKCKTIKTEGNFENDFWTKSYNSGFMGFQEVT